MKNAFIRILITTIILANTLACDLGGSSENERIQTGAYFNLRVYSYDTIFKGGYYKPESLDLDVDKDGLKDFRITSHIWGSPGIGQHPEADISCLHPYASLNVIRQIDTSFLYRRYDTFYSNKVEIYLRNWYVCQRVSPSDSVIDIKESRYARVFQKADFISESDSWYSGDLDLNYDGYNIPYRVIYNSADTSIIQDIVYNNNCYSFPDEKISYLGFKIFKDGNSKLGWIQLSITDKYRIAILESAIQK